MNEKEFSKFYEENVAKIFRFIFLKVDSTETAQDLTSEAFLKFLKYFDQKKSIDNPRAFLYQIARNLVIDFYREKTESTLPLEEGTISLDERQSPEIMAAIASDMDRVKKTLGQIDKEHADIIVWRYLDDLPISEIGRILSRPEGTVRVMLHRGLKELRELLS